MGVAPGSQDAGWRATGSAVGSVRAFESGFIGSVSTIRCNMGTNDRDKKFGGSLVDGIKRTFVGGRTEKTEEPVDLIDALKDDLSDYGFLEPELPLPGVRRGRELLQRRLLGTYPKPVPPEPYLWTLHHREMNDEVSDGQVTWRKTPPVVFRAQSIFVQGPGHHLITIIMANQLVIDSCPIRLLNTCHTLEELQQLSVGGKLGVGLLNCPALTPATQAIIRHSGSVEWVAFYGLMIP